MIEKQNEKRELMADKLQKAQNKNFELELEKTQQMLLSMEQRIYEKVKREMEEMKPEKERGIDMQKQQEQTTYEALSVKV